MNRIVMLSLLTGCLSIGGLANAEPSREATAALAEGRALLTQSDFEGALEAYKTAARKAPGNQDYAQQYAMLRQVIQMRRVLPREQDLERWLKMAGALRTFYYDHELHTEALALDQERYRRQPSADSGLLLAETQLAVGRDAEAVELLAEVSAGQMSARADALYGLALARLGRMDEAKKALERPKMGKEDIGPDYYLDLARVRILLGNAGGAVAALTRSFQLTPPSQLDTLKARVKRNTEFGSLAQHPGYAQAFETASEIQESGCSMGSSCGECPMRAKCAQGKAQSSDE
jgi:tetratricopeptide (TPR) repeat protein